MTRRKLKPTIPVKREVWRSMQYIPRKMKCNLDTARDLAEVFGDKIYNDLDIIITDKQIFVTTAEEVKKTDGN